VHASVANRCRATTVKRVASGDGIALARQLCSELELAVIFTTGQPHTARANACCAIGLLIKPYDPHAIIEVVDYAQAVLQGRPATLPTGLAVFEAFARGR
jgi:hypothetical protein